MTNAKYENRRNTDGITTEMMEHMHCLNCGQRLKWEV